MSGKYRIWESLKKLMLPMSDILSFNHSTACRAAMAWRLGTPTPRHVRPYRKGNKKKGGNFRLMHSLDTGETDKTVRSRIKRGKKKLLWVNLTRLKSLRKKST